MALEVTQIKKISAYVDSELSTETALEVEAWFKESEECRQLYRDLTRLDQVLVDTSDSQVPAEFSSRLASSLSQRDRGIRQKRRPVATRWSAAAAILIFFSVLSYSLTSHFTAKIGELEQQLSVKDFLMAAGTEHRRVFEHSHGVSHDADYSTAIRQVSTALNQPYKEGDLKLKNSQFVGLCECQLPVADITRHLSYTYGGKRFSLFVIKAVKPIICTSMKPVTSGDRTYRTGTCSGYNTVQWSVDGVIYFMIGDLQTGDLISLMDQVLS